MRARADTSQGHRFLAPLGLQLKGPESQAGQPLRFLGPPGDTALLDQARQLARGVARSPETRGACGKPVPSTLGVGLGQDQRGQQLPATGGPSRARQAGVQHGRGFLGHRRVGRTQCGDNGMAQVVPRLGLEQQGYGRPGVPPLHENSGSSAARRRHLGPCSLPRQQRLPQWVQPPAHRRRA